jgi:hypothetical protein
MKVTNRIRPRLEELEGRLVPALSYSTNWAGYAVTAGAGAVSQVGGSWVVPTVATNVSGYSSAWVGIDGFNSNSVEQIGTDSDYVNGVAHYYAWYEMYPNPSVNLSLSISPGDAISASVTFTSPNLFGLTITDTTTGAMYSTSKTSSSAQRSSAEWIQEAPSSYSGVLPLANFGTINFAGANATVNGSNGPIDNPSGGTVNQIDMVTNSGSPKATTSAFTDSGSSATSSFSVTWNSSGVSSGGGGRHHRSPDAPLSTPTPSISVPLASSASNPAATAVFTTAVATTTTALPAPITAAVQPTLTPLSATVVPFEGDTGDVLVPAVDGDRVDAPNPNAHTVAANLASGSAVDFGVEPVADPIPASHADTNTTAGFATNAAVGGNVWHGGAQVEDIALAGLALAFTFDRRWLHSPGKPTAKRNGRNRQVALPEG